jgi:3-hydroxyisobutyrate dehydrogenase-like beta-hydroxyacid dehydrogenase
MAAPAAGVIGLGIMGSAMAGSLLRAGFVVHGYDIAASRRAGLRRMGGHPARSAAEVARRSKVMISSLPSARALQDVVSQLDSGRAIVVETSTLPIEEKTLARDTLAEKGITLLDCPLSGTGAQAKTGDLVVYASGDKSAYAKALPVLKGFSRSQHYLGAFGNGSRMKFVANLLVAIHNVSAAEAFVLGMKAGLAPDLIYRVVGDGAGSSRVFQIRGPLMAKGRYAPATMKVGIWQKDMKIIGEFAASLGAATPLFSATAPLYNAAMAQGFADGDTAAVCAVLERLSGVRRSRRSRHG